MSYFQVYQLENTTVHQDQSIKLIDPDPELTNKTLNNTQNTNDTQIIHDTTQNSSQIEDLLIETTRFDSSPVLILVPLLLYSFFKGRNKKKSI